MVGRKRLAGQVMRDAVGTGDVRYKFTCSGIGGEEGGRRGVRVDGQVGPQTRRWSDINGGLMLC